MPAPTINPPPAGSADDLRALSTSHRRTLQFLFAHPIAHNLEWRDIVSLFAAIGGVEEKPNGEVSFRIGRAGHVMRAPHAKDLGVEEVLTLRHFAASAGWTSAGRQTEHAAAPALPGLAVVVDHHEARIFGADMSSRNAAEHTIRPHDLHHFLHHLTHKDQSRERGQRAPEEAAFYEAIARAVVAAPWSVLVGHGEGKSKCGASSRGASAGATSRDVRARHGGGGGEYLPPDGGAKVRSGAGGTPVRHVLTCAAFA